MMSIVVDEDTTVYFSRLAIVYISFCVECCGTSCMRLQCCLQNSSAAKGTDRCALVSNGVKKVVPKRYSQLLAEMQRSYNQGKGGIVVFEC